MDPTALPFPAIVPHPAGRDDGLHHLRRTCPRAGPATRTGVRATAALGDDPHVWCRTCATPAHLLTSAWAADQPDRDGPAAVLAIVPPAGPVEHRWVWSGATPPWPYLLTGSTPPQPDEPTWPAVGPVPAGIATWLVSTSAAFNLPWSAGWRVAPDDLAACRAVVQLTWTLLHGHGGLSVDDALECATSWATPAG